MIYFSRESIFTINLYAISGPMTKSKNKTNTKRKTKAKSSKNKNRYFELLIIAGIVLFTILLWDTIIIYPIKLFVILLHEISHAFAAFFTGGKVEVIKINYYLGGVTVTEGGNRFLIASAGYLGSLFFGSALFVSSYNQKLSKYICTTITVVLLIFAANLLQGSATIFSSLFFAALLFLSPRYFSKTVHSYLMKTIGMISSLYVLTDIKEDILSNSDRITDAKLLESISGIPSMAFGLFWLVISAVIIFLLIRHSYGKGLKISK